MMAAQLRRIFLIDDDEDTNFLHNRMLQKEGCVDQVDVYFNAKDALRDLSKEGVNPELILLDLNMPTMSGWDFLKELQNEKDISENGLKIIILSVSLNPDDRKKAKDFPFVAGFETKILNGERFRIILKKLFPQTI